MDGQYPLSVLFHFYWKEKPQFVKPYAVNSFWVMFAIEDGKFSFEIEGVRGEAASGDIVLCPSYMRFDRQMIDPLSFHYIGFVFRGGEEAKAAQTNDLLRNRFAYKFATSERDRLFNNFRHLRRLSRFDDPNSNRWKLHFISDLWLLFRMEAESFAQYGNVAGDPLMKKAKELIEQQAFRDFRMQDVAELLNMHPVHFTRRFQQVFGISPSRYLFAIRMEKAKSLLVQTDYTIDHIARLCGYDNGFYFSRMFTKYTKMNPSLYRRIHGFPSP
jgi:AraC-like DNA-binding protein